MQQITPLSNIQQFPAKHIPKKQDNKKNDYSLNFINTGERPQNFIRDILPQERFQEYPRLNELIKLKDELILQRNTPGMCIKSEIKNIDFSYLGKFDVILMDPPWEEYKRRVKMQFPQQADKYQQWSLEEISKIPIESLADQPSFMFLWVGSEGLEQGRELFKKWGYKRCEDIVWVKTNKNRQNSDHIFFQENQLMQRVKEHCLVGLKEVNMQRGDMKRPSDQFFIHANIDTDVIVAEEPEFADTEKPEEIYNIIERFCLGRKRIELFGRQKRDGWLTIGPNVPPTDYDKQLYESFFDDEYDYTGKKYYQGGRLLGTTAEIENLRPKSPRLQPQQVPQMISEGMQILEQQLLDPNLRPGKMQGEKIIKM